MENNPFSLNKMQMHFRRSIANNKREKNKE